MRRVFYAVLLIPVLAVTACQSVAPPAETAVEVDAPRDGVFIHVSHGANHAHRVLMALSMANKMADQDRDVLVYFDISGIEAVVNDAPDLTMEPFQSSLTQLESLRSKGVTLMACPGCLKAAGKSEADLMDGVVVADAGAFFAFTEGRILSLDY